VANWAIFELLVEKDTENDSQSGELQVLETECRDLYSFVRMAWNVELNCKNSDKSITYVPWNCDDYGTAGELDRRIRKNG
jgi:hypothetical protein